MVKINFITSKLWRTSPDFYFYIRVLMEEKLHHSNAALTRDSFLFSCYLLCTRYNLIAYSCPKPHMEKKYIWCCSVHDKAPKSPFISTGAVVKAKNMLCTNTFFQNDVFASESTCFNISVMYARVGQYMANQTDGCFSLLWSVVLPHGTILYCVTTPYGIMLPNLLTEHQGCF